MKKFVLTIFVLAVALFAFGQERKISGKVTSTEDGTPLPGVSVVLKGTATGTVTDADGVYALSIPANGGSLTFSFIGLRSQEVAIGERSVVDISLSLDVTQLSEVIVTGTGVATEKKKIAFAVESITSDKLPQAPTASIDQALIGKIAGAQITSSSGTPGASTNILLRGINNLNSTNPMILMDGIQMGVTNINSIDMATVERIEVVQGAAAATIYGAQGANGVIQLFSKKGKPGKLQIDFTSSVANNQYLNIGGLRKANLHGFNTNSSNEVIGSSGNPLAQDPATLAYSENVIYNSTDPTVLMNKPYNQNLKYYDHFKMFLQPANTFNNSISLSGGSDKFDFAVTASNNKQENNFKGDGYNDRSNLTTNFGVELAKGLKLRSLTQLVYTKNTVSLYQKQEFGINSLVYGLFNARPFANYDMKDEDGNYAYYYGDATGVNQTNPFYTLQYSHTNDIKTDILQNFNLTYDVTKFLSFDVKYGINHQARSITYKVDNQSLNENSNDQASWVSWNNTGDNSGELSRWDGSRTFQNFLGKATLNLDFTKDFNMSIPLKSTTWVGYDYRTRTNKLYATYGLGLPIDPPFPANLTSSQRILEDSRFTFATYGYIVDQRFDYGELFGVSGGFRSDYSSAYGLGKIAQTFPRANGYVRLTSFDFWNNTGLGDAIVEWKLRAAYGKAGIQPGDYDRQVTLANRLLGTGTSSLYFPTANSNPNLGVQISTEKELGTDMTFGGASGDWFKNFNLAFTYWDRTSDQIIYDIDAAPTSGVGTIKDNAFTLASHGIQASLNAHILEKTNLNWNMTINYSKQSSEITAVKGGNPVVVLSAAGSTNYVLKAGDKVGQLYGYHILRSVTETAADGTPYIAAADQALYETASNGYVVNKTTKAPYFTAQQISFGDPNPKFMMSFINDIAYKNFLTFNFQFDWLQGNHLYNQTKEWMYRDGIHSDYEKPITINGETGAWSAFYRGIYAERSRNGTKDYFYEDASFVRLRNVAIGLDFSKLLDLKTRKIQLVLTGRNLWTKTKYTGLDPEISSGTVNSPWDRGTDHNTMPNFKTYQATLNIGL
jgi:TonB-dependent starch-binding outer membrane protein SusC